MQQIRDMRGNLVLIFQRALPVTSIYITSISWSADVWHENRVQNNSACGVFVWERRGVDVINQVPQARASLHLFSLCSQHTSELRGIFCTPPLLNPSFFVLERGGWSQIKSNYSICSEIQSKLPFPATDFNGQVCWRFWEHTTHFQQLWKQDYI